MQLYCLIDIALATLSITCNCSAFQVTMQTAQPIMTEQARRRMLTVQSS